MAEQNEMSLVEHLGELRKRIIWVVLVLALGMVIGLFSAQPLIELLRNIPPANGMDWSVFSPWDAIRLYMNFSLIIGLIIVVPFAMFQLWGFVKPGLRLEEQKASLIYIPVALFLLLCGMAFSYGVVFPMAFMFSSSVSKNMGLKEVYGAAQYFSFMFNIVIPLSLMFELPVVVMFLTKLRILNPNRLSTMRRYAYMALVVLATVITPPDAVSAIIVTGPLIVLYEVSVMLSRVVYRKQLLKDAEWEAENGGK